MFGFQGDETAEAVARKKGYLRDVQKHWKFLTHYDLSTIRTKGQFCNMIKVRASLSEEQATKDVDAWMAGKVF